LQAFVAYLMVFNGLFLILFESNPKADFYLLTALLTIRRKQEFVQTKIMKLYLLNLYAGMPLCIIEPVIKLGFVCVGILIFVFLHG
jgi:hypothetical protein